MNSCLEFRSCGKETMKIYSIKRTALSFSLYDCGACMKAQFWVLYSSGTCFCVSVMKEFCEKGHNTLSCACPTYLHLPILHALHINLFVYRNLLCDLSLKYLFVSTDIYHGNMVNHLKITGNYMYHLA